jgi:hypothetical protein
MSITLDNLSPTAEQALVVRATAENKSVDRVASEIIESALGVAANANPSSGKKRDLSFLSEGPPLEPEVLDALAAKRRDLSDLAGTWVDDPEFDAALEAQSQIDPELWK